jgi:hypothetical protein
MDKTTFRPVIRTQSDLEELWRRLMSPLGFSSRSLWTVLVEDERPLPQITEFTEMPEAPDDEIAERLVEVLEDLATPQISLAFLCSRPGAGRPDSTDLAWARTLYSVGNRAGVRLETIHLAHDHDVVPMPMDDVLGQSA